MEKKIRIQKILSENGIMSRREAEKSIKKGIIKVNGHVISLGTKIDPLKDIIRIGNKKISLNGSRENIYIMLYKPRGYVTTTKDELGRKCVMDLVEDVKKRIYPVGRLDKVSEGLLLLTNDGIFANFMMHPSSGITKTYRVSVKNQLSEKQLLNLSTGVYIDGYKTLPAKVSVISTEDKRSVFNITISEGKNRQIRRMCEAVGLSVIRLKRIAIGNLKLGMLKSGQYRNLDINDLKKVSTVFNHIKNVNQVNKILTEKESK